MLKVVFLAGLVSTSFAFRKFHCYSNSWCLIDFFQMIRPFSYSFSSFSSSECGDVQLQKVGCFKRDANLFKDMLANNRDAQSNHFTGSVIDWNNFETSLQRFYSYLNAYYTKLSYHLETT